MKSAIILLVWPIILFNFLGGLVGGVWLMFLGQWHLVILSFVLYVLGQWIVTILLLPQMLLIMPVAWVQDKGNPTLSFIFGAVGAVWAYIAMIAWVVVVFFAFLHSYSSGPLLPYLLTAYSVSTGIWTYMARQEAKNPDDSGSSIMGAFFLCLGTFGMFIGALLHFTTYQLIGILLIALLASYILQMTSLYQLIKAD